MSKLAVVAFGRMAPVTVGHRKLALKLQALAEERHGDALLYLSRRYDGIDAAKPAREPRNPLKHSDKVRYVRDAFGDIVTVVGEEHRDIFSVLRSLYAQGYSEVIVVGDAPFLQTRVEAYNGKEYFFKSLEKVLSGERDEASSDFVATVSATQVRQAVACNNYELFARLVATRSATTQLWATLRAEMGYVYAWGPAAAPCIVGHVNANDEEYR